MTKTAVRTDTTNRGGIAKDSHSAGFNFYVVWEGPNGEACEALHNNARESIPAMLARHGVQLKDALIQKM